MAAGRSGLSRLPTVVVSLAVLGGVAAMVLGHRHVRNLEAWASASIVDRLGILAADPFGTAIVFPMDHRWLGFTITAGCSVAFLLPPFFVVVAGLIASRRVGVGRALFALLTVVTALLVVNQLRLLIVAASVRAWGYETGYERSHILLGTLASTLGVVIGVVLFLYLLTRNPARAAADG